MITETLNEDLRRGVRARLSERTLFQLRGRRQYVGEEGHCVTCAGTRLNHPLWNVNSKAPALV